MALSTNSILLTVKKMLGISEEYTAFDIDLIVNINSVFLTLNQLGVGPEEPYQIEGSEETWDDFLLDQRKKFPGLQTYVYLKTRLLFDPPTNSFLVDAMQKQCDEFEWRLNIQAEGGKSDGDVLDGTDSDESPNPDLGETDDGIGEAILSARKAREIRLLKASWNKGNEVGS